jgi:hypothetical protein
MIIIIDLDSSVPVRPGSLFAPWQISICRDPER